MWKVCELKKAPHNKQQPIIQNGLRSGAHAVEKTAERVLVHDEVHLDAREAFQPRLHFGDLETMLLRLQEHVATQRLRNPYRAAPCVACEEQLVVDGPLARGL